MLTAIHSGGQTGVDTAALTAASILGFKTGGYAPQGWRDERGTNEAWMRKMGLVECSRNGWAARTEMNVLSTDGTLIISHERVLTGGSYQTMCLCESLQKPMKQVWLKGMNQAIDGDWEFIDTSLRLSMWLKMYEIGTLNIAGPRESKRPGIGERACVWLLEHLQ